MASMSSVAVCGQVLAGPSGAAQKHQALGSSATVAKSAHSTHQVIGKVAGARPVQTIVKWDLFRIAIGQSSLFLTSPEASHLALVCRDLNGFLENVCAEGGFWSFGQHERAIFSQALIWLHPIASLKDAVQFASRARSLRLRGGASVMDQNEVRSLTGILQMEAAYALRVGEVIDTFSKRFLLSWKFDLDRIADLLDNRSLLEVVSDDVSFICKYGISFALNLAVSKSSFQSAELTFRFDVRMIGKCRSSIEIKACGSIIAPNPEKSIVTLKPVVGGTCLPQNRTMSEDEDDDFYEPVLDTECSQEWKRFSRLLSIVRVHIVPVSLCIAPVRLGTEAEHV